MIKYEDLKCEYCNGAGTKERNDDGADVEYDCFFCNGTGVDFDQLKQMNKENPNTMTTKEELDEAIANLKLLIEGDWKLSRPIQKTIITILTRYRDGELVEKKYLIDSIEKTLNPKYMNDVFTWNEILKAISPTPPTNQTEKP